MITLPEMLKDKRFKEFFCSVPKQPANAKNNWRVYVQRKSDGNWARKDFDRYADAFRLVAKQLKAGNLHDGTIQSRGIAYAPPQRIVAVVRGGKPVYQVRKDGKRIQKTAVVIWKPKLAADEEPHTWCTYCRRPTVFRWFNSHHSFRGTVLEGLLNPADMRCLICGGREEFIRKTAATALVPGQDPTPKPRSRRR